MRLRKFTVLLFSLPFFLALFFLASCSFFSSEASEEKKVLEICGYTNVIPFNHYTVSLNVPNDEPCTAGTYTLHIRTPKNTTQRITMSRVGRVVDFKIEDSNKNGVPKIFVMLAKKTDIFEQEEKLFKKVIRKESTVE